MENNKKSLLDLLKLPQSEIFEALNAHENGLTDAEVENQSKTFGANVIAPAKKKNPLVGFADVLINPFNLVLIVVIIITFISDILLTKEKDYLTVSILIGIVMISTLISYIQDERSSSASAKLLNMVSNTTAALRNGEFVEIPIDTIVMGDIIRLSAGDIMPADVRVLSAKDLFISQATLTGESHPVEKFTTFDPKLTDGESDYTNLCLMGTNVVSGTAQALVIRIGNDTYLGTMNRSLKNTKHQNSFEASISTISRLLMRLMLIMLPIIFIINGVLKHDFLQAFVFALTVAVGLTPEMLPVVLSSGLARGAINMAKHQTIVKSQSAISSFGEMDILCTDKTGTITQDEIILERYMNVSGKDDMRVLRHAFLNSYFQSGLKNLIDVAIIKRAETYNLHDLINFYTVIDEIPFDFTRRRMSVVLKDSNNKHQIITKGAVEEILKICKYIDRDGKVTLLDDKTRKEAMDTYAKYNNDGLRMIAVAQKNDLPNKKAFSVKDEKDLALIGFIGFLDPPKESAKPTIKSLHEHGVDVVVITGDSLGVAQKVCAKVGIDTSVTYMGKDIEAMSDEELQDVVPNCYLFAKISPVQKQRIVQAFQAREHTVGFLGDGINDALALKQADVGISVDTAVDIAKESADIILLKKDLTVLEEGILEGRKTIINMIKYLELAVSGNFGNMFSVLIASIFLPFLPLLPVHILIQNLINDLAQMGIPFDYCDEDDMQKPHKLGSKRLVRFMGLFGPVSSIFDVMCFLILWFILGINTPEKQTYFQTFWFTFGVISQTLIIFVIRSNKIFSVKNRPSWVMTLTATLAIIIALVIVTTPLAYLLDFVTLPLTHLTWLLGIVALYMITSLIIKNTVWKRMYPHI